VFFLKHIHTNNYVLKIQIFLENYDDFLAKYFFEDILTGDYFVPDSCSPKFFVYFCSQKFK